MKSSAALGILVCGFLLSVPSGGQVNSQSRAPTPQTTQGKCSPILNGSGNTANCYIASPKPTYQQKLISLRVEANRLAQQLFDYLYAREGPSDSWQQDAIAQAFLDAATGHGDDSSAFNKRLKERNVETMLGFREIYLPNLLRLRDHLVEGGVDVSPLTRALAIGDPRRITMMLSVVADRVGKRPPFDRTLTPLEARMIIQGFGAMPITIYALVSDTNSKRIAETLRKEFEREHSKVNSVVLPLNPQDTQKGGVHFIFPSADWTVNYAGMLRTFGMCEFQFQVEIRPVKQPPSLFQIEVWPGESIDPTTIVPPSLVSVPK